MLLLKSVNELLKHIKSVESDTIELSKKATLKLATFIEKSGCTLDDDAAEALQYQDIISQQLSATIDAIECVEQSIQRFEYAYSEDESLAIESMAKLQEKLSSAISIAQDKRDSFSGKTKHDNEDEILFF